MYIPGDDNVHLAEVENRLSRLSRLSEAGGVAVIGAREERWGEVCCVVSALQEQAKRSLEAILEYGRLKLVWFKQSSQVVYVNE
jgi:acyl-CoA synthetase (AMP-forming)/AMP-acid ligase II